MANIEDFLTPNEEQEIVEAIRLAELNTSGEIRVHIESSANGDAAKRALELFHFLKMDNTKLQNGVLFYVAVTDRHFVIYGDKGINDVVDTNFWNSTKDIMQAYFKKNQFKDGLVNGIKRAGLELQAHFPYFDNDTNELSNAISKG